MAVAIIGLRGVLLIGLLFLLTATGVFAEEAKTELLWLEGAPGATGQRDADKPSVTIHLPAPEKANGTAVVICPGGGYGALMMSYEGNDIAKWLNDFGVVGIVLKYRVSPYRQPVPLQDAQRALRYVRAHATEWKIDPKRIGIMGFSAGGHVAASLGTHYDAGTPQAIDPLDQVSCRPDFLLLIYPVITMGEKTHQGSRDNLLGKTPTPETVASYSCETQVTDDTPPTFLAHAKTDTLVPVENSALFYAACLAHKVPAEFDELPTGQHGLGCGKGPEWQQWQERCVGWLRGRGLVGVEEK